MANVTQRTPAPEVELRDLGKGLRRLERRTEPHHDGIERHVSQREPFAIRKDGQSAFLHRQIDGGRLSRPRDRLVYLEHRPSPPGRFSQTNQLASIASRTGGPRTRPSA
jgi:hypothetical protein